MTPRDAAPPRRLLLVQLNELSFDLLQRYVHDHRLKAFAKLMAGHFISTTAEQEYDLLEPWIQWPSVYTGHSAHDHGLTRLGDAVGLALPQIFEQLEQDGIRVGTVAAINAVNRLRQAAYFVPDPWTATHSDGSWWSKHLGAAITQIVNDNASGRLTPRSAGHLALGVLRFAQPRHWALYARLAATSVGASWRKALFLDLFLHDLHWHLFHRTQAQFSTLFLNAGAHIQHHYMFGARGCRPDGVAVPADYLRPGQDPVAEMLRLYDGLLGQLLGMRGVDLVVATGLSQVPYDSNKTYWRLREHSAFLRQIGVAHRRVRPRMSRDFLIEFDSVEQARQGAARLASARVEPSGLPLFGTIEDRGDALFVTLTFPHAVVPEHQIVWPGGQTPLAPAVVWVAQKSGMHRSLGHAYFSPGIAHLAPAPGAHIKGLNATIRAYFAPAAAPPNVAVHGAALHGATLHGATLATA